MTAAIVGVDPRPDTLLRHLYIAPVIAAGALGGVAPGIGAAIITVFLQMPLLLPHLEREGLTRGSLEGLVSFAMVLLVGASTGATTWAARERGRYRTLIAIQRAVTADIDLAEAAARARRVVEAALAPATVGLFVADAGGAPVTETGGVPMSVVDEVRRTGGARFVADLGGAARPRRAMLAPVLAEERVLGVLVVVRDGEISRAERATVLALGAYIGLAVENARLAAAQRRSAAELAERIAAATRELTTLDRAKSDFVAVASHELRTPLTALRGFSELLGTRTFSAGEVQRYAGVMQGEAERLSRMVDDLLDLSRIDQGKAPVLRRTWLDPAGALRAATTIFERPGVAHRIDVDAPADLPAIHADPDAFDRIVKNLVGNAMKYSPPPGPVQVSARARDGMVEFVVADRGPGIPAEALPRLFEPYFRAADGAHAPRGTGLGLAVVRALVDAHGGAVHVESAREIGTRMCFTIPSDS